MVSKKKKPKIDTRSDKQRLYEIIKILTLPYSSEELEFLSVDQKLNLLIRPNSHPIYRRKILKALPIMGLWWMDELQWTRFLWNGHNKAKIIRTDEELDKVYTTRTYMKGGNCYIRENGDFVDIEAQTQYRKWDAEKKKEGRNTFEWMTCTITKEYYDTLEDYLGPIDQGCKHG